MVNGFPGSKVDASATSTVFVPFSTGEVVFVVTMMTVVVVVVVVIVVVVVVVDRTQHIHPVKPHAPRVVEVAPVLYKYWKPLFNVLPFSHFSSSVPSDVG